MPIQANQLLDDHYQAIQHNIGVLYHGLLDLYKQEALDGGNPDIEGLKRLFFEFYDILNLIVDNTNPVKTISTGQEINGYNWMEMPETSYVTYFNRLIEIQTYMIDRLKSYEL